MKTKYLSIFLLILILWGGFVFHFGYQMTPDSFTYSRWADVLISHHFNVISFLRSVDFNTPPYLYLGFVTVVALAKEIAGIYWPWLIVALNLILGAFVAVMIADVVYLLTKNRLIVWIIVFLYAFNPEIILWSRLVLSDVSYMFLNFLIFYFLTKLFFSPSSTNISFWIIIAVILCLNFFYRPSGIVMIPLVLFAWYLSTRKNKISWKWVFGIFAGLILIALVAHTMVIQNINLWPFQFGERYLTEQVVRNYQNGVVIHNRPYTFHQRPSGFFDYFSITIDKLFGFFYFSDRNFSIFHRLINYAIFLPLYFLGIMGIIRAGKEQTAPLKRSLIFLIVIVIITYCVFYAMTVIDYDWRYRLAIMPYLLVVAGIFILTSIISFCPLYQPFGLNTTKKE